MFQTTESAFIVGVSELKLAACFYLPLQVCRRRLKRVLWEIWDKAQGKSETLFPSAVPSEIWSVRMNKTDGLIRKGRGKNLHCTTQSQTHKMQQSQDSTYPDWQELLFASVEVIIDSFTGSGRRWVLRPWLPLPVSSLQAALANACTSAMSRHACQLGMWWHSTIPLANYPAWREVSRDKKEGRWKDFQNIRVE